jgi:DNA-binding response OmpR family regulator
MASSQAGSLKSTPGPLIAVVEDEQPIRALLLRILSMEGYRVEAFASARDALAWFEGDIGALDLLITDVCMPGMSGKELADEICKRRSDAKILFISGYSPYTEEDMNACGNREERLLRKPFGPGELVERVKSILEPKPGRGVQGPD